MWQIVHGTYFERVGRGVIPHGPGSVMAWTQAQAESYGLERLRKVAQEPVVDDAPEDDIDALREQAEALGIAVDRRWGVPRMTKEIDNAATSKRK